MHKTLGDMAQLLGRPYFKETGKYKCSHHLVRGPDFRVLEAPVFRFTTPHNAEQTDASHHGSYLQCPLWMTHLKLCHSVVQA